MLVLFALAIMACEAADPVPVADPIPPRVQEMIDILNSPYSDGIDLRLNRVLGFPDDNPVDHVFLFPLLPPLLADGPRPRCQLDAVATDEEIEAFYECADEARDDPNATLEPGSIGARKMMKGIGPSRH